jgi:hypothetical protein
VDALERHAAVKDGVEQSGRRDVVELGAGDDRSLQGGQRHAHRRQGEAAAWELIDDLLHREAAQHARQRRRIGAHGRCELRAGPRTPCQSIGDPELGGDIEELCRH